jgi:hypothetical protein
VNILGIIASSKLTAAGSFESIATVTVGSGGSSTITFSSIPGTYKHLQFRGIILVNNAGDIDITAQFNSDTGSNYSEHYLYGSGTAVASGGGTNLTKISTFYSYFSTGTTDFAPGVFDILDYADTNKYKTVRGITGPADQNLLVYRSSLWRSTSAITSVTFTSTGTMKQYSQIALYGIKGA